MALNETYSAWLKKQVGDINPAARYELKFSSKNDDDDLVPVNLELDLVWYILLQINDEAQIKLDVALALLQDATYQQQFKATQQLPEAKRILTEFLLSNYIFLVGLKQYLEFKDLDQPIDFISHALLISFSDEPDSPAMQQRRFMIVELALNSGFTIDTKVAIEKADGAAIRKVLLMDAVTGRYKLVKRLLTVGFTLFSADPVNNSEIAVLLLNNRNDADCLEIIKQNRAQLAEIKIRVAGDMKSSNLADYYYWVKEDMATVGFIRETLGIDISS